MARFAVAVSLCLLLAALAPAQSDPQALAYASQSITVITDGTAIRDVTVGITEDLRP